MAFEIRFLTLTGRSDCLTPNKPQSPSYSISNWARRVLCCAESSLSSAHWNCVFYLPDSDLSMRTLSTPSPALIFPPNSPGFQNGRGSSTSSSSVTGETVAMVHSPPPTRLTHPLIRLASKHQKEQANIDRLPDQAMIQIFSFLPTNQLCRCARVCRRWYNLAWDPRLWRTIRLTGETINVDRALKVLTRRLCQDTPNVCLMLETVIVSGCRRLTDRGLYTIAQCCPELRRLEVSGCYNISNEAVFDVVSLCPNLEHLDVSGNRECSNAGSFGVCQTP